MKTILICGHGPGISDAVARKFGAEGFRVAIAARSQDKLEAAAAALKAKGIDAKAFPCDLADPKAVTELVANVRASLGPITVVHYNAYGGGGGDLTTGGVDGLRQSLDIAVTGLVATVQAALPDLREQKKDAAVLITGGGFAFYDANVDGMAAQYGAMGLAVGKAAQHKLAGVLHEKLRGEGIYVGEVVVLGMVKGTAFDSGNATLEPSAIAERFWSIYGERKERSVNVS